MDCPILNFLKKYDKENPLRLHMPGHKGESFLGFEGFDLTEVDGADSLFDASGIIAESEKNASKLFACQTYYSTEGSTQVIKAMLYLCLIYAKMKGQKPIILAGRNAHKSFLNAVGLLNFDVKWLYSSAKEGYLSCNITPKQIEGKLKSLKNKPIAVYLTSPDYLGNILDISGISEVCKKYGVLLLVDNAHGSYLRFLEKSLFPIDLGADMCCSSAHKTLPVITGGAYLHISSSFSEKISVKPKTALSIFCSTSPSYLILASLDNANAIISSGYKDKLNSFIKVVDRLKSELILNGFELVGNEPLKITLNALSIGYSGFEIANFLREKSVVCEFCDNNFVVFMLNVYNGEKGVEKLREILFSIDKKEKIEDVKLDAVKPKRGKSIREAILSDSEEVLVDDCLGRILAQTTVSCPPAVPIICCGEIIDEKAIQALKYYGIKRCLVVKN